MTLTINKYIVVYLEISKELSPIKYLHKPYKESSNPFIGSLDLETFVDLDGYSKVYALGFVTRKEEDNPVIFYLNDSSSSSEQLILNCFELLLSNKYDGYIFYVHNFGGFDAVFILKVLTEANKKNGTEYYKLSTTYRDDRLLKLDIRVKNRSGFNKISIVDSYNLLSGSLDNLYHSFDLDVSKGKFPHRFVRRDTLNYVGSTPPINYWKDLSVEEYKHFYKTDWSLKQECINYLEKDLLSLLKVMDTFNRYVFNKYDLQITHSLTVSRLALNIFIKDYLKQSKLPIIKQNMFSDIKQAYFGGVTEVYKPYGENLYYYDVNSLYPFASLNPMPSTNCTYLEYFNSSPNIQDLFGFFYCEIESQDNYLGLLPVHSDLGLIMPNGRWSGWYFSEELKFASLNNYNVKIIKGYNFNKQENVFNDYVSHLYEIKSSNKGLIKVIAKSLLNNLLGRFGMGINKPLN